MIERGPLERIGADLAERIGALDLAVPESDPNPVFGVRDDLTLCYFNPAWFRFAAENGGEPDISRRFGLGRFFPDAISGRARDYCVRRYEESLASGEPWDFDYECSSPEVFRLYHQRVYPLRTGKALLSVNSLIVERPHGASRRSSEPIEERFRDEHGLLAQCSNCRRFRERDRRERWHWVPDWIERRPTGTSHTFCPICYEYYFSRTATGR